MPTERDYTQIRAKFDALVPWPRNWDCPARASCSSPGPEVERLARNHGVSSDGAAAGRPLLDTDIRAADAIFTLSGTTNGRISTEGWDTLSKRTGTHAGRAQ